MSNGWLPSEFPESLPRGIFWDTNGSHQQWVIIALVPIALPDCAVPVLFERVCEALVEEIDHSLSSGLGPVIDLVSGPRVVI